MVFAAGLGTRLQPLTDSMPKAMVKVQGKPLLHYAIQNVLKAGATRIVVNVHHFPRQIIDYIGQLHVREAEIFVSDETDMLLETGGGLLKAAPLFIPGKPILVHNADVLTNCNLSHLVAFHRQRNAMATLMVAHRDTQRYMLFDPVSSMLKGWINTQTGQLKGVVSPENYNYMAFNGIHLIDFGLLDLLGEVRKFSITDGYLQLANTLPIVGWSQWEGQWYDVGTLEKLRLAEHDFYQL
ncbi:MAG: sugar phosphate nucleotidyltransferase [Breznakibacter sp.]